MGMWHHGPLGSPVWGSCLPLNQKSCKKMEKVAKNEKAFSLWAVATKNKISTDEVNSMVQEHWNGH